MNAEKFGFGETAFRVLGLYARLQSRTRDSAYFDLLSRECLSPPNTWTFRGKVHVHHPCDGPNVEAVVMVVLPRGYLQTKRRSKVMDRVVKAIFAAVEIPRDVIYQADFLEWYYDGDTQSRNFHVSGNYEIW